MSVMLTASEFAAESERRMLDMENSRAKRRAELEEAAAHNWPELAKEIEKQAKWHLRKSEVPKDIVLEILKLRSVDILDAENVIKVLAQKHGFEINSQYECLPMGWIFSWPKASE